MTMSGPMDQFIRPHQQNARQPGFWKAANGGSDDEAEIENQIKSSAPATEVSGNVENGTEEASDAPQHSEVTSLLQSPFLKSSKVKKQRQETSWVYNHFHQMTLKEEFLDKHTGKMKADIQYSCVYCTAPGQWVTRKFIMKGSTSNLQRHLALKHDIYKDQDTSGIFINASHF